MEINTNLELKHFPFPSIGQYRNLIHNVNHASTYIGKDENDEPIYDTSRPKPTLDFTGTVKLHGTNAAIVMDFEKQQMYFQSRTNIITPLKDNAGFANTMANIQDLILEKLKDIFLINFIDKSNLVYILYGEWCGGNIQKGVALNQLDKMFVIFNICIINKKTNSSFWFSTDIIKEFEIPENKIYNIYDFPTYSISIDFNYPELSQNKLVELTLTVEKECPVAKTFGKNGCGEGIVWHCTTPGYEDSKYWMKVKGEEHQSSKTTILAPILVENIETIRDFIDNTVTDSRCNQSISILKETNTIIDRKVLGEFISWIVRDILKEEVDTIVANNIDPKKLGKYISDKARIWFFQNELTFNK